jgi:protease-4
MWLSLDLIRRLVLNFLFLAILIGLILVWWRSGPPEVPERAALVITPKGNIVEQLSGNARQRAINEILGQQTRETLLKDVLDGIDLAKNDRQVQAIFLNLNAMGGAGLTKLQTIRAALDEFKTTGKKVIAAADNYQQSPYYLASAADEVLLHEKGLLLLEGYSRFGTYYKDGLDRLKVDWNVFRVGEYKSAVEPYVRDDMSEEAKQANIEWLGDLWRAYLEDVSSARNLTVEELEYEIVTLGESVKEHEGDIAKAVLEMGLVDRLVTRDEVRDRMIELVGEDEETHSFNQIGLASYLEAVREDHSEDSANRIGIVVAKGTILDGRQGPGNIGGDSTAALIRKAKRDDNIKAVVLRVDSGGGSAFASDVIHRELALVREAGKPVVVSMGSVAASGGYMIAMASDEVWANPATITGSIGIFAMFPTFNRALSSHLGVNVDGVGTTPYSGALRTDRELRPEVGELIQEAVEHGYRQFVGSVAESREMEYEEVELIARGRVWSGQDAFDLGLVDHLGGLDEAIESAARHADISADYSVQIIEPAADWKARLMGRLLGFVPGMISSGQDETTRGPVSEFRSMVLNQVQTLNQFNDPRGIYAYCVCEVE